MAKFNVTVELDWLDEEQNLDEAIKDEIVSNIVNRVQGKLLRQTEDECQKRIKEQMAHIETKVAEKLNNIMDDFFNTPYDVTDQYGDVIQRGVTVKKILKRACDNFINQSLDKDGRPTKDHWSIKYNTRIDYFVEKTIDSSMSYAITKAVKEIKDKMQQKISNEVKSQIGEKLSNIIGLDEMLKK